MPALRCHRCEKRYRGRGDWNCTLRQGVVLNVTCPDCLTTTENLEAAINEATIEYGRDPIGRVIGRPR